MDNLQIAISVLGGLALFVYGMGLMSRGLSDSAGDRMKAVLECMTRNRVFAIFAGAGVTALVQSSSATTVMTVGFVNAGLLSLEQAIGVVFGANVGTTVTGQIVSFKLDALALPAIILGVTCLMVAKRTRPRGVARVLLGFGLLFYGMTLMSAELKVLARDPGFVAFFKAFDCTPGADGRLPFGAVLGGVAVGTLCTTLVQSSSATIGITIALAEAGVISFWTAVPVVLGDNIGTTVTAWLAALGGNVNARRTALAHSLFNVIGTVLVVASFGIVLPDAAGRSAPVFFRAVDFLTRGDGLAGENPGRHVAAAHSLFNVANVCILSLFIPALARLCVRLIPDRAHASRTNPLEPLLLAAPDVAVGAAVRALRDMAQRAMTLVCAAFRSGLGDASLPEESLHEAENDIDRRRDEIQNYLVLISRQKLGGRAARALPELAHCANDAERIADLALLLNRRLQRGLDRLSPDEREALRGALSSLHALSRHARRALAGESGAAGEAHRQERDINEGIHAAGGRTGPVCVGILSVFRDISRHLGNIATRAPSFA